MPRTKKLPATLVPPVPDVIPTVPAAIKIKASTKGLIKLDTLFPGEVNLGVREKLMSGHTAEIGGLKYAADFDADGNVMAIAAAVSRTPMRSEQYLSTSVPDLQSTGGLTRQQKITLFHEIAKKEGIVNNALKKKASIVSQEGSFNVRTAKQGKRPSSKVSADLLTLLTFWMENVNSAPDEGAITGSRGIKQVIRRGSRQSLIEGDLFLREQWRPVAIPQLDNKKYKLPITLQAISSAEIEIVEDLIGIGAELYYWVPTGAKVRNLLNPKDPNVKKILDKIVDSKILNELKKNRKVLLDPALLIHIKNAGTDPDAYGDSDVEAVLTDLAYARALKSLDFVTIDSLINRILVIKIGDPNPESAYHTLATAQQRVNVFNRLVQDVGPNMLIVWAGHDIETTDIGAHNQLLDTTARHELSSQAVKLGMGVPDALLTGNAPGGNAVAWAGFISLAAVVSELQEEWSQALTQLGMRIAAENKFDDVDLIWEFSHELLADREANSKIMTQAYDRGTLSIHTYLEELGKTYEVEREHLLDEKELGDLELFVPRAVNAGPDGITGGPGGNQGVEPKSSPGRPTKTEDTTKTGPDRDREKKNLGQ